MNTRFNMILGCLLVGVTQLGLVSDCAKPDASPSNTIVNGEVSDFSRWPFMAHVRTEYEIKKFDICGGVVWNRNTILTAAHCVKRGIKATNPGSVLVHLGHTNAKVAYANPDLTYTVDMVTFNSDYDPATNQNNIAVIRLTRNISLTEPNDRVRPVARPLPLADFNLEACITIGWGLKLSSDTSVSDEMRQLQLPVKKANVCFGGFDVKYDQTKQICAGPLYYNATTNANDNHLGKCFGYPGGPLVCPLRNAPRTFHLIGLSSLRYTDCRTVPLYFLQVEPYLDWIETHSGEKSLATKSVGGLSTKARKKTPVMPLLPNPNLP